jgi:hypothetical protein
MGGGGYSYTGNPLLDVALPPLIAGAWKNLGPKITWTSSGSTKSKKKIRKRSNAGSVIRKDGTGIGTGRFKKKRKVKRRKKSAKKLISELKRNLPTKSTKTYRDFETYCLAADVPNEHRMFAFNPVDVSQIETQVAALKQDDGTTAMDYRASKSSIKVKWYYKLMCKNNATGNAKISYCFYKCMDDDTEGVLTNVREGLIDRGYTGVPTVVAYSAALTTRSAFPERMIFNDTTPYHAPVMSCKEVNRKWKKLGKIQTATVGPGDTFEIIKSGRLTYSPEVLDNEVFTYQKGTSIQLVIKIHGDLGHDISNDKLVARDRFQIDCEEQRQKTYIYANPLGLKEIAYSDTLANTAELTSLVHADNMASAIETADS